MRGGMGLLLDCLEADHLSWLQKRLTLTSRPFQDKPTTTVRSFHIEDGYFWVPRFFDWMNLWSKITPAGWQWVAPFLDYDLKSKFTADPTKQQPEAIEALVSHLQRHSSAIGVLPTGTGKTYLALEIGRHFQTPIAVLVHKGDMIDNWIEHCETHLGIPERDVAIIKEDSYAEGKPVTICSIQTLLSRDLPDSFYEQFGFIVADEVHHYGAQQWSKVISRFPARYRLGISADPIRDDGLDPIVRWSFGKVGFGIYKPTSGETPLVCMVRYPTDHCDKVTCIGKDCERHYCIRKYRDWKRVQTTEGPRWQLGPANAMKYAKLLAADKERNSWLVGKIIDARAKGRRVLIFTKLREHLAALHDEFVQRWTAAMAQIENAPDNTKVAKLWGGLKDRERHAAMKADVTFTTYGFSREATNLPHKDTLVLATPAGNPLQTIGRLRDKGAGDRKSFLAIDPFEGIDYSFKKAMQRRQVYWSLGIEVRRYGKQS